MEIDAGRADLPLALSLYTVATKGWPLNSLIQADTLVL